MQNCSVQSRDKEGSAAGGNSAATAMPAATATRAGSIVGSSTGSKTPRRAHQYQRDANVRDMFTEREREITGEQARERERRGERAASSSPSQAWQLANERTKRTRRLIMLTQTSVCAQEQQKQQRQQRQRIQQIHTQFENTGFFSFSLSLSLFSRRPSSLTKICFHFSVNGGTWLSLDVCERMRGICMCV